MKVHTLYHAVVASGLALGASACASTASAPTSSTEPEAEPPKSDQASKPDCMKICDQWPGREAFCPDPAMDNRKNCCWLMAAGAHVCCDTEG